MFESARNRYLAVGIAVYLLELIVIGLCQFSGLSALVAISIGFWVGIVASFLLQKIVAFEDTRSHNKIIIAQVVAYGMLVVLNYTFTLLLTQVLAAFIPLILIRTIALAITTVWNYYLYKVHIFVPAKDL